MEFGVIKYFIALIITLSVSMLQAQSDSTFSIKRQGKVTSFSFTKSKSETCQVSSSDLNRMFLLLAKFAELEETYDSLNESRLSVDSLLLQKESQYSETIEMYKKRIENYQTENALLIQQNAILNSDLKSCISLAQTHHQNHKDSVLSFIIAFVIGLSIGGLLF